MRNALLLSALCMASGIPAFPQAIEVTSTGVGIGTQTPVAPLDVKVAGDSVVIYNKGDNRMAIQSYIDGHWLDRATYTPSETRLLLQPDGGNVGVGTADPATTLDVKGTFTARDSSGNAKLKTGSNVIVVADAVGDSEFGFKIERNGWIGFCSYLTNGAYGGLSQNGDKGILFSDGQIDTGSFIIAPWNSTSGGIKIKSNGYIGINTNNTPERLTVNGKVKSKGFITDTSNWSDYVFNKDYKLPTLTEVEQHIAKNGHLPGIPSEKEVMANGVDLGDMQVKLLAQIEQLTLHMIAHQKAIDALQQENASLKRELKVVTKSEYTAHAPLQ